MPYVPRVTPQPDWDKLSALDRRAFSTILSASRHITPLERGNWWSLLLTFDPTGPGTA